MDELERIREEKLREAQKQQQEISELQKQIDQIEAIVKRVMTKEAIQRYSNLKTAHPEKAVQLLTVLGQAIQQGKIESITDEMLKDILRKMIPEKRETKIRRV
ncbi:DNA-binding protein [Nanoarchaeota archaeon]